MESDVSVGYAHSRLYMAVKPAIIFIVLLIFVIVPVSCVPVTQTPPAGQAPSAPSGELPEQEPPDLIPPGITVTYSIEGPSGTTVVFTWAGNDDVTAQEELIYSFYLEDIDPVYSPYSTITTATYTELPEGTYTFYVKSKDSAGNIGTGSVTLTIAGKEQSPSETGPQESVTSTLLISPGSDVSRICIGSDGDTIYALDTPNSQLYRSDHGGYGWENISGNIPAGTYWNAMAIAPDDPDIIAVVTDYGTEVYVSVDGGNNFYATGAYENLGAMERITCISISPAYGNLSRDIGAGTATGNGGGTILINTFSRFSGSWYDAGREETGWKPGPASPGVDVFAIEYAPSFAADAVILAVVASGPDKSTGDTSLYLGHKDLAGKSIIWNQDAGYPVELCEAGQDTPGTPITYADLAIPFDYAGTSPGRRHIYACWSDNPQGKPSGGNNNDDVYRVDDAICYRLQAHSDAICSIAYFGDYDNGKLLAGAIASTAQYSYSSIQVYITLNPQSAYPTWTPSQKPPSGPGNARVAWSPDGTKAYCGTSGTGGAGYDQSAFSMSTDNDKTWNQTGLIDT
jgi:hypothetical protein